ncbi:MAG: SDR family oxidoreductase [Chloroflexi bacterium]|nr:SDR family oxidoreductase [Chloroflexota bacterium]OJV99354.1 MAG: NAD(P)-dependent oxidoreductase [Chloroflexi bacterium 54-19]
MAGTIIVTGGSRGIGAATALLAARKGYAVCVNYTEQAGRAEQIVETIRQEGGRAIAVQADVSDEAAVKVMFDRTEAELGDITGLVTNAAITGKATRLADLQVADLRRVLEVNILGTIVCCREAVRRMSTALGGSGGSIVNISSRAAHYGAPGEYVHYAASKAAIESFTFGLAGEVGPEGIRVNCVSPGVIDTEIHATAGDPEKAGRVGSRAPLQRPGRADEVAAAILWLLSEEASYCSGTVLAVSGGR